MAPSYPKDDSVAKVVVEKSHMLQEDFARSALFPTMGGKPKDQADICIVLRCIHYHAEVKQTFLRGHQPSSIPLHLYWRHILHYRYSIALCYTQVNSRSSLQKHNNQTPLWRTGRGPHLPKMYLRGVGQVCATRFFYHINNLKHFWGNSW